MSVMTYTTKPTWLNHYDRLMEIANYHLYLPSDIPLFSSTEHMLSFNSGLRQYLYWKSQLLPSLQASTVFIALLGPKGLQQPNILNITAALKNVCDLTQICEFYSGSNTNFLALSFTSKKQVDKIISHFRFFEDAVVLAITHNSTPLHRFRLLWLPPMFDVTRVHHLLNKYSKSHRIRRESMPIAGGAFTPTNVISGTITLEPGADINKLPYLIQLPSPHKGCALLTIESRPPLCLKCRAIGHTRNKCTMVKCHTCTKVHFPDSPCGISSYSAVASRNITTSTEGDWLANLAEDDAPPDADSNLHIISSPLPPDSSMIFPADSITLSTLDKPFASKSSTGNYNAAECDHTHEVSPGSTSLTFQHTEAIFHQDPQPTLPQDISSYNTMQHSHNISIAAAKHPSLDDQSSVIASPSSGTTNTVATFARHKATSKVHIKEKPPTASHTARSHLISYSVAPSRSTLRQHKTSVPSEQSSIDILFGDPDPNSIFSSDVDSSAEPESPSHNMIIDESLSRKRKVSTSSLDPFALALEPASPGEDSSLDSFSFVASSTSSPMDSLTPPLDPLPTFDPEASPFQVSLRQRVATLFAASTEQVHQLELVCPDACYTTDLLKAFQLLRENGILIHNIISSPHVLKLKLSELKRKVKFVQKHLGAFTIKDICSQESLEDKFLAGHILTASESFT